MPSIPEIKKDIKNVVFSSVKVWCQELAVLKGSWQAPEAWECEMPGEDTGEDAALVGVEVTEY